MPRCFMERRCVKSPNQQFWYCYNYLRCIPPLLDYPPIGPIGPGPVLGTGALMTATMPYGFNSCYRSCMINTGGNYQFCSTICRPHEM